MADPNGVGQEQMTRQREGEDDWCSKKVKKETQVAVVKNYFLVVVQMNLVVNIFAVMKVYFIVVEVGSVVVAVHMELVITCDTSCIVCLDRVFL